MSERAGRGEARRRKRSTAFERRALLGLAALIAAALALDPARAQSQDAAPLAASPGCEAVAAPVGATPVEAAAWSAICRGAVVDPSRADGRGCDVADDVDWGENRRIRARFVSIILFAEPYRSARAEAPVRLRCVWIDEPLDLSHRRLDAALRLEESRLYGGVSLFDAETARTLSFLGSRIAGGFDAESFRSAGDLFLRGVEVTGAASLAGARIGGALEASVARFDGGFDLAGARIGGSVALDGVETRGGLRLAGLSAQGDVALNAARLEGDVEATALTAGGALALSQALVAGDLRLDGARLDRGLLADGLAVRRGLSLAGARIGGAARLLQAEIAGEADFSEARSEGALALGGARLGGVALRRAEIAGPVDLGAARIDGPVDLGGARIDGALRLASAEVATAFGPQARLSLKKARLGALDARPAALTLTDGAPLPVDLTGVAILDGSIFAEPWSELKAWWRAGLTAGQGYDSQAFRTLAAGLARAGRDSAARDAAYAERAAYLAAGRAEAAEAVGLRLLDWIAGFGQRPERALIWLALLTGLGVAVAASAPRLSRLGVGRLFRLSFENTLPWPQLSGERRRLYRAGGGLAAFFMAQRLLGAAVLATTLLAALAAAKPGLLG